MDKVVERFLRYIKYDTQSKEDSESYPSTHGQLVLLKDIFKELKDIGMEDVTMDEYGYVFGTLPSNIERKVPTVGFIAHVDTSPDMAGANVNARIIENYHGKDIVLNEELKIVLSPKDYPELKNYTGKTLIVSDGTTLLGADDKAGVAEIITAMEYFIEHPEIKHGTIRVGFTPDEEVGRGTEYFDVKKFNADFGYTIDGGKIGELEYENFNAAGAKITIKGKNVHPGSAKGIMKNSLLIASELAAMLPADETPAQTEGYEGFYHLNTMKGSVEETVMNYIIRDFDRQNFEKRKSTMKDIVCRLNARYGEGTVFLDMKDQYYNMKEKILPNKYIVDIAYKAMEEAGIKPIVNPIRGGTDGARLSYMGFPCPNIFTGGHNFHGRYEFIPTFAMEKAVEVIVSIAKNIASQF